ncbi:hypothetical protein Bca52824_031320 [Brassica carinata]|uniref:Uncharacterized protein n=1 Tax=Brassica carinata TaxID=52824 RepID=A0A8X7V569_BRACI|nr:hypothetical protein Bca52824_031320 [Brassica carinata]
MRHGSSQSSISAVREAEMQGSASRFRSLGDTSLIYGVSRWGWVKTLQAISFLSYLKFHRAWLVVRDKRFTPKLEVLRYVGDKDCHRDLRKLMHDYVSKSFKESLLPYDIALVDQDFLSQIPWQYAVIDEAQMLKIPNSVASAECRVQNGMG